MSHVAFISPGQRARHDHITAIGVRRGLPLPRGSRLLILPGSVGTCIALVALQGGSSKRPRRRRIHSNAFGVTAESRRSRRWRAVHVSQQVFDRFREDAITAIYSAQEEAMRQGYGVVCTELVVLGMLSDDQKSGNRVAKTALVRKGVNREALKKGVSDLATTRGPVAAPSSGSLPFSDNAKNLFDAANAETPEGQDIGTEQLLLALSQPSMAKCGAAKLLASLGCSGDELRAALAEVMALPADQKELAAVGAGSGSGDAELTLDQVAVDLTMMARDGLLDPVVGRAKEMQRIIQILLRKRKNNACLVGPPGVGKTAVVEGLAQLIVQGKVPSRLKGKQLYSLDLGQLVAGTKYRGEFEDRLKKVIAEVTSDERDVCLFIDEIHQLVGAGQAGPDSSMDAANLLKPCLARGELQVIGATTSDEYTRHVEKDAALERRFQRVVCEEPSVQETVEVLEGLQESYEAFHGVLITHDAILAAARLSDRYISDRFLPDKAVDVMDEASSLAQWRFEGQVDEAFEGAADATGLPAEDVERRPLVTAADIAEAISISSGVPVETVGQDESGRLLRLEQTLAERVVGQEEAVSALARAVRRARAGLAGRTRPTASFYFAGPTGVGKTELCKVLAMEYYSDPKAMIRLDMSEYAEAHSVSKLVGAPPGYVGYDDPRSGQLTESVRRRPYSVVVLDEIEKAHPEVMNMLLQVLEDGRLTDGKGRTVNFSNCIIVMTSNIGSKEILQQAGGIGSYAEMRAAVQMQLQQRFRPEFLNRIDELLVFRALGHEELQKIVRLVLRESAFRAVQSHEDATTQVNGNSSPLELSWTEALEQMILESGTGAAYGARPLRRAVQRCFEDPVAELLVSGALSGGGAAVVDLHDDDASVLVRYDGATLRPQYTALASGGLERWQPPGTKTAPVREGASLQTAVAVS